MIVAMFRIIALVTWLTLAPIIVIHRVFGSLTGFIFLLLLLPALSALLMLRHPHHYLLSGIIIYVTFVTPACWHYFIEVF
jgi:hypothetical protein